MKTNLELARACGATERQITGERHKRLECTPAQLDAFAERIKAQKRVTETQKASINVQLSALRHELDVSLYNAGLRNCASAIRKAAQ